MSKESENSKVNPEGQIPLSVAVSRARTEVYALAARSGLPACVLLGVIAELRADLVAADAAQQQRDMIRIQSQQKEEKKADE